MLGELLVRVRHSFGIAPLAQGFGNGGPGGGRDLDVVHVAPAILGALVFGTGMMLTMPMGERAPSTT